MIGKTVVRGLMAAASLLSVSVVVRGQEITLSPTANARMVQWLPNYSFTQPDWLSVYTASNGNVERSLLQFDLSGIPLGAVVQSATLTLYSELYEGDDGYNPIGVGDNPSNEPIEIMRVTQPWSAAGVTWNSSGLAPWTVNGGSVGGGAFVGTDGTYSGSPYASNNSNPMTEGTPVLWDVTSLVRDWVSGDPNYGLLLRSYYSSSNPDNGSGRTDLYANLSTFYSGDPGVVTTESGQYSTAGFAYAGPNGSYTPVLDIEYTVVPEPATLTLLGSALLGLGVVYLRRRRAKA